MFSQNFIQIKDHQILFWLSCVVSILKNRYIYIFVPLAQSSVIRIGIHTNADTGSVLQHASFGSESKCSKKNFKQISNKILGKCYGKSREIKEQLFFFGFFSSDLTLGAGFYRIRNLQADPDPGGLPIMRIRTHRPWPCQIPVFFYLLLMSSPSRNSASDSPSSTELLLLLVSVPAGRPPSTATLPAAASFTPTVVLLFRGWLETGGGWLWSAAAESFLATSNKEPESEPHTEGAEEGSSLPTSPPPLVRRSGSAFDDRRQAVVQLLPKIVWWWEYKFK